MWQKQMPGVARLGADDSLTLDADTVKTYDGAAEALIVELYRCAAAQGFSIRCQDAQGVIAHTLKVFDPAVFTDRAVKDIPARGTQVRLQLGEAAVRIWSDAMDQLAFLGEVTAATFSLIVRPGRLRLRDTMLCFERTGMDALPITLLIGFLIGLILGFQSATTLRQFGGEVYVADFIAYGLFREMGALVTAILLAGRTGSAFAAELGTMKVNEEIDALTTFGLPPVTFLALPRVLAVTLALPFLSVFAIAAGLIGGLIVLWSIGIPTVTYWLHVSDMLTLNNISVGLIKAVTFGLIVGMVGCAHGLRANRSADSVGQAATAAVVGSLVLMTVVDGIFAVLFYVLNI
ncbi:MAG: ABC transporter permease [Kiritimatiellaeota bacterium]|nr:ABC transporter permease [Kiritimatiellota bacterium]